MRDEGLPRVVLVIRPGALGDTILTLPILMAITRRHPAASVTFMGTRAHQDLIPTEVKFLPIDSPQALWLFDSAVSAPQFVRIVGATAYVMLKKPDHVITALKEAGALHMFTADPSPPQGVHLVAHLADALGLDTPPKVPSLLWLAPAGSRSGLWVHPGSGGMHKRLPVGVFAELAAAWGAKTGEPVWVTLGPADGLVEQDPEFARLAKTTDGRILRNLSLKEVCGTLSGSRLYIGNDSGISHLAAALGVPSLVFFRSTDPRQWAPWSASARFELRAGQIRS